MRWMGTGRTDGASTAATVGEAAARDDTAEVGEAQTRAGWSMLRSPVILGVLEAFGAGLERAA